MSACLPAAAKDKVEDAAPGRASNASATVTEVASIAKGLVPNSVYDAGSAVSKAADSNPLSGFVGGARHRGFALRRL